jgi:NNP family nitrate/nitrite transporter-like MFS transporter
VLQISFKSTGSVNPALAAAQIAWIGPLLGSIARPYGGKLADRFGGGRITMICFGAMTAAALILVAAGTIADGHANHKIETRSWPRSSPVSRCCS